MNTLKKFANSLYKLKYFIIILILPTVLSAQKQNQNNFSDSWVVGYQLNEIGNNFGYGLHAQSPRLANFMSLKLRGNLQYFSFIDRIKEQEDWLKYYNTALSMVFHGPNFGNIQPYGESGIALTLPPSDFMNRKIGFKGFGVFGANIFFNPSFAFFFEAGGIGGSGSGDINGITYTIDNGFFISTGFSIAL